MHHGVDPFGIVGKVLDGQFRVERLVGEGGFSAVYRGHHLGLEEPIAVKCLKLPPSLSPELVEQFSKRFRDESRILYRLSQGNLNIVRSVAAGTWQTNAGVMVPYMILEWMEGRSLANEFTIRRTVGQQGRSLTDVVKVFGPAADGLGYAHAQGVVHRDLNPGNLFLASSSQGTRMKVLDFGVAKILDDSTLDIARTQTVGAIRIFAPAYGAPEQFDDSIGPISAATDVYSFALILLEALRDRCVNDGQHLGDFAQRAIDPAKRPTPRMLGMSVPDEVEQIFARATKLNPRERWQSAGELWQALAIAASAASREKHVQAAMETPSLGMPQNPRSTKTGMAPPPNTEPPARPPHAPAQHPQGQGPTSQGQDPQGAKPQAAQGKSAPSLKTTMPIGAVLPQIAAQRAAAAVPAPPSSLEIMKLADSDPDEDDPTKIGARSPMTPLSEPEDEPTRVRAPEAEMLRGLADAPSAFGPHAGRQPEAAATPRAPVKQDLSKTMPLTGAHPLGLNTHHAAGGGPVPAAGTPMFAQHGPAQPPPHQGYPQQPPMQQQPMQQQMQQAMMQSQPQMPPMQSGPYGHAAPGYRMGEAASMPPSSVAGVPAKSNVGLLVGISVGVVALVGIVAGGIFLMTREPADGDASAGTIPSAIPSAVASEPPPPQPPPQPPPSEPEPPPTAAASEAPPSDPPTASVEPPPTPVPTTPVTPTPTPTVAPTPTPTAAPTAAKDAGRPLDPNQFNEPAARSKLAQANGVLAFCKKPDGPTGAGSAMVTFTSDGVVSDVKLDPPYAGTSVGDCVVGQLKRTKIASYVGSPQSLKHTFDVPK